MKTLLTFLFMVVFLAGPSLVKLIFKKPEKKKRPVIKTPSYTDFESDFEDDNPVEEGDSFLQKSKAKIPKQPEYFTYETIDSESRNFVETPEKKKENDAQMSENEQKNALNLTFEEEELCKGVIYSEILKRKYN